MYMYKCEDCGLLTSKEIYECPQCNSIKNKLFVDMDDEEGVVYKLTMEDVDYVIDEYFEDEKEEIRNNYTDAQIQQIMISNLEIEWTEYVSAVINCRLLDRY